jgi:hypothetical protein
LRERRGGELAHDRERPSARNGFQKCPAIHDLISPFCRSIA